MPCNQGTQQIKLSHWELKDEGYDWKGAIIYFVFSETQINFLIWNVIISYSDNTKMDLMNGLMYEECK